MCDVLRFKVSDGSKEESCEGRKIFVCVLYDNRCLTGNLERVVVVVGCLR